MQAGQSRTRQGEEEEERDGQETDDDIMGARRKTIQNRVSVT